MEKKFSLVPYGWQVFPGEQGLTTRSPMEQVVHDMRLYDAKCNRFVYDSRHGEWMDMVAETHYDLATDIYTDGTLLVAYYAWLHYPPEEVFRYCMFPDEEIGRYKTYSREEKVNFILQYARKKGCVTNKVGELLTTVAPEDFFYHYVRKTPRDGEAVQPPPTGRTGY